MENLQQATEKICDLKGNVLVLEAFISALIRVLPTKTLQALETTFLSESEALKIDLLHAEISEHTVSAAERDIQRLSTILRKRLDQ